MAESNEGSRLIPVAPESTSSSRCGVLERTTLLIIAVLIFQIAGVVPLISYFARTLFCCIKEKHPFYHCHENSCFMGMGHKDAKTFELIFSIEEVLSRSILTILCFKLMYKKQQLCSILLKMVLNQQFWILFATLCACEFRFSIILTDKDDLTGSEIEIDQPTIIFYMIDAAVTTLLVGILNFVKLQDLAKDNISEPNKVLKRIKTIDVTKKGLVKLLLKCVLFIFWLQSFTYFLLQIALIAFYVFDVEKVSVGEDRQKAYSVLTRFGELAFLRRVIGYLWEKLFDDDNCYLGSRAKQTDVQG